MRASRTFPTAICLAIALLGCRERPSGESATKTPAIEPVARVNGVAIPRDAFDRELAKITQRYQTAGRELNPGLRQRLESTVVNGMVENEVIRQQAAKLGVSVSSADVDKEWQANRRRYGGTGDAPSPPDAVRPQIEETLLRERVLAKIGDSITVTPEEVRDFYDKNQARFVEPEQIRMSQIVIRIPPGATPDQKADLKKRAEGILAKVKAKNADFAKLAAEYDEGPNKARGGDLGFVARGRMWKPVEDAVWPLKNGESTLVESPVAFLIIEKTGHADSRQKSFDEVKDQIEQLLRVQKRNDEFRKFRADSKIEILVKSQAAEPAHPQGVPVAPAPTAAGAATPAAS